MATRVGIELSPTACRIVEVDAGLPWRRPTGDTRVLSFAVLPPSGAETRAKLKSLRRRDAAVVVWSSRSEHRQVMVTAGPYEAMRREAMATLAAAGLELHGVWADIASASPAHDTASRRPVLVSVANGPDLAAALQPLRDAGIQVRTVTTPAVALGSLARRRQALAVPGTIESYVAFDEQVTCMALVRGGALLAARDLPWGFIDADDRHNAPRSRDDMTTRLAEAISEFAATIGGSPRDIGQVCVCGGLPELRSMAAALMERLDVEVEPLDSLFGIDAARLPEPVEEFRERGAELRLAWAAATDWPPAINLLRARRRGASKTWLARAAVVAGAAAGVGGSWWVVERSQLWSRPAATARATENAARGRAAVKPASAPVVVTRAPVVAPPPVVAAKAPVVVSAPVVAKAPVVVPPPVVTRAPVVVPPPVAVAKPPAVASPPVVVPPARAATPSPDVVEKRAVEGPRRTLAEEPRLAVTPAPKPDAPARVRPAPPPEQALPFDAVLGTILYSADRQLAIVDDRIVGIGDEVRGARIVEITAAAVMLRDERGRLRRLDLGGGR